jgi:hypothetical protein
MSSPFLGVSVRSLSFGVARLPEKAPFSPDW